MSDLTSQEVLCAWARERYDLSIAFTRVEFDMDEGFDGGCDTCGYGNEPPSVEVLLYDENRLVHTAYESYVPELINSIVEVGLRGI